MKLGRPRLTDGLRVHERACERAWADSRYKNDNEYRQLQIQYSSNYQKQNLKTIRAQRHLNRIKTKMEKLEDLKKERDRILVNILTRLDILEVAFLDLRDKFQNKGVD